MRYKKVVINAFILWILICSAAMFTACAEKEKQELETGEYYVAEELTGTGIFHYKVVDDFLYYICYQNEEASLNRIKINGGVTFENGEELLSAASLRGYTADREQNLYTCTMFQGHVNLCAWSPEGERKFELSLEGEIPQSTGKVGCLAADGAGNVYVLVQNVICRIDGEGNLTGRYSTAEWQDPFGSEYLLEAWDGEVYYINVGQQRNIFRITGDGAGLKKEEALKGYFNTPNLSLYPGQGQILLAETDGVLYGYSGEQEGLKPLLKWEDSNLNGSQVYQVAQLPGGELLVSTASNGFSERHLYLLSHTSAEELPEKEIVVLASLFPSDRLREAAVDFNRMDGPYRVTVESYGANFEYPGDQDVNKGAYARLNSSISSGQADILDLTYLDFNQYAVKDAFLDLFPYLEKGSLKKEDFLDNVLEGYTVDGKQLCIPRRFYFRTVAGRASEVGTEPGWTAEELMALADAGGKSAVVGNQDGVDMVGGLFAGYCLEGFIDWEKRECSFDSAGFRGLLRWIREHTEDGIFEMSYSSKVPQELFLREEYIHSFLDCLVLTMKFGEDITLVGYPSGDGTAGIRAKATDTLGILSSTSHKDGAWAFLEYYLSREDDEYQEKFFTRKSLLQKQAEDAVEPFYVPDGAGGWLTGEDGSYVTAEKGKIYIEGEPIPYEYVPREQVDAVLEAIGNIDFTPESVQEQAIVDILVQEAAGYFNGEKSLDETVRVIQNRVQLVLGEQTS